MSAPLGPSPRRAPPPLRGPKGVFGGCPQRVGALPWGAATWGEYFSPPRGPGARPPGAALTRVAAPSSSRASANLVAHVVELRGDSEVVALARQPVLSAGARVLRPRYRP